jgi:type II secretory pathway component PulM
MDVGLTELVEKILHGVSFIAIGGALATLFFLVFAPSILGSKTIQKQLDRIQQQAEHINQQLKQIVESLQRRKDDSEEKD